MAWAPPPVAGLVPTCASGGVGVGGGAVCRRVPRMHRGSRPWGRPDGVEEGVELGPYEVVVLAYEVDEPVPPVVYGWFDMTLALSLIHI